MQRSHSLTSWQLKSCNKIVFNLIWPSGQPESLLVQVVVLSPSFTPKTKHKIH